MNTDVNRSVSFNNKDIYVYNV